MYTLLPRCNTVNFMYPNVLEHCTVEPHAWTKKYFEMFGFHETEFGRDSEIKTVSFPILCQ